MKWRRRKSDDVIDIRGKGAGGGGMSFPGGGGGGLPIPGGMAGGGGGTIVIILIILFIVLRSCGGDGGGSLDPGADRQQPIPPSEDPQKDLKDFSVYVFEDSQDTWRQIFKAQGSKYSDAEMVLYTGSVNSGCGSATSAVGPFYCPADDRIYLDPSFYNDMEQQLQAPGDFAWAYVIAHEMGHHTQDLLGASEGVDTNAESVRLELQADCYSGVWGATVFEEGALEEGDLEEAFTAAEAVGDDRLQKKAGQEIDPDSFTHGTSEQRREWFTRGYESGDPAVCDTFSAEEL